MELQIYRDSSKICNLLQMTAYSQETEMVGPINLHCTTDEMYFNNKNLK